MTRPHSIPETKNIENNPGISENKKAFDIICHSVNHPVIMPVVRVAFKWPHFPSIVSIRNMFDWCKSQIRQMNSQTRNHYNKGLRGCLLCIVRHIIPLSVLAMRRSFFGFIILAFCIQNYFNILMRCIAKLAGPAFLCIFLWGVRFQIPNFTWLNWELCSFVPFFIYPSLDGCILSIKADFSEVSILIHWSN